MKVSGFIQSILVGLTLLTFMPSAFAAEETPAEGSTQGPAGRDPASKHKGKKKHHHKRHGRHK